jgi:hypothetical protein
MRGRQPWTSPAFGVVVHGCRFPRPRPPRNRPLDRSEGGFARGHHCFFTTFVVKVPRMALLIVSTIVIVCRLSALNV